MRHLVVFDVDGTLIKHLGDSAGVGNDQCYLRAIEEALNLPGFRDQVKTWTGFKHHSDSAITAELYRRHRSREPQPEEIEFLKTRLQELLARDFPPGGAHFEPVAGAGPMLAAVRELRMWDLAIATGNWAASARFKLANAGLVVDGIPMAAAEDGTEKAAIITAAMARAREATGTDRYRRVVYIGDSTRDVDAAAELEIGFLGIGSGPRIIDLMDAGAVTIFRDFADLETFLASLREFER